MIRYDKKVYADNLPSGMPVYYQPWFLDATADDWEALIHISNSQIKWMWGCASKRKWGVKLYYEPHFSLENCPIIFDEEYVLHNGINIQSLCYHFRFSDRRNQLPNLSSLKKVKKTRHILDFDTFPTKISGIKKSSTRNKLRNPAADIIRRECDFEKLQVVHESSCKRRGEPIHSIEEKRQLYKQLKPHLDQYIFILEDENGVPAAGQWIIGYDGVLYDMIRAKNYNLNAKGAQEYLMWNIVQKLRENYFVFDLCGSSIPGVRQYNNRMNATEINYSHYSKFHPEILSSIKRLYDEYIKKYVSRNADLL